MRRAVRQCGASACSGRSILCRTVCTCPWRLSKRHLCTVALCFCKLHPLLYTRHALHARQHRSWQIRVWCQHHLLNGTFNMQGGVWGYAEGEAAGAAGACAVAGGDHRAAVAADGAHWPGAAVVRPRPAHICMMNPNKTCHWKCPWCDRIRMHTLRHIQYLLAAQASSLQT